MGRMKKFHMELEDELRGLRSDLEDLEAELHYLEHEHESIARRIELQKDLIHNKECAINEEIEYFLDQQDRYNDLKGSL